MRMGEGQAMPGEEDHLAIPQLVVRGDPTPHRIIKAFPLPSEQPPNLPHRFIAVKASRLKLAAHGGGY